MVKLERMWFRGYMLPHYQMKLLENITEKQKIKVLPWQEIELNFDEVIGVVFGPTGTALFRNGPYVSHVRIHFIQ